ncbi:MAG: hypothetical protein Q9217_005281 [Psora testacea]
MRVDTVPETIRQWTVEGQRGFDSLQLNEAAPLPELGDTECLVHFYFASLNYRDLLVTKGKYLFGSKDQVVPCSDGAGEIMAVGSKVKRFQPGDRVVTLLHQGHLSGSLTPTTISTTGVGGTIDGCLREYGAFSEQGLVAIPESLNYAQASTLPCAAITAWNALYGLESRSLKPGDTVLTQGTGGVSLFALQFAKAAGATVISTTSSETKSQLLRSLGADHILNYRSDPNWGETARNLTPTRHGVTHIVEIGGPNTLVQSFKAIKIDGVISVIGFLGGAVGKGAPSFLDVLGKVCTVRGVLAGSRQQMEDMTRAIEVGKVKPVIDERVWDFEEVKEAMVYMWEQKHVGKVVIKISDE